MLQYDRRLRYPTGNRRLGVEYFSPSLMVPRERTVTAPAMKGNSMLERGGGGLLVSDRLSSESLSTCLAFVCVDAGFRFDGARGSSLRKNGFAFGLVCCGKGDMIVPDKNSGDSNTSRV